MAASPNVFRRAEKKYLLNPQQYQTLMQRIAPELEADAYGAYTICNIYFDTAHDELIRRSIDKPPYKEKLRLRSYGTPKETDTVFLELKKKWKGIVYKRRACMPLSQARALLAGERPEAPNQILREILYFLDFYHPVPRLFLAYDRLAYHGREDQSLRLTVDTHIRSRRQKLDLALGSQGRPLLEQEAYLLEIKTPTALPLWLTQALNALKIYPASFSKYGNVYKSEKFALQKECLNHVLKYSDGQYGDPVHNQCADLHRGGAGLRVDHRPGLYDPQHLH